ncbi:MAG TPA: hypothetical protein PLS81_00450 [Deltaproteobacteria bacterium]|nr:hypothetical protein [Deltaproteobacteria bacterium]HOM27911.1 hypothetical protein [Deltaproteobacteria bacterium]HPP79433.1 hypothetical protein [Deltaproteobacteria bacterium]
MSRYAALAAAVLLCALILVLQSPEGDKTEGGNSPRVRRLLNVTMVERSHTTGRTVRITASEVIEDHLGTAHLVGLKAEDAGGSFLEAPRAVYDMKTSVLKVEGPTSITAGGWLTMKLNGISWDLENDSGGTAEAVTIEGRGSVITAPRAAFSSRFSTITLSGGVHAEISRDVLDL